MYKSFYIGLLFEKGAPNKKIKGSYIYFMRKTRFRGHETFYFRDGWVSKALYELNNNPSTELFKSRHTMMESISKLGIGSNMVSSIKYWLVTCGLMEQNRKEKKYDLTEIGKLIANKDLYLEDMFSLWLLHINLMDNFENATTWYFFFNYFKAESFTKEEALNALYGYMIGNDINVTEKALAADLLVLLNMYSKSEEKEDPEDNISCPLSQIGLIKKTDNIYKKNNPNLNDVHEYIILFAILRTIEKNNNREVRKNDHISINKLEDGDMSLTNIFGISRVVVSEYLDRLSSQGWLRLEKTSGLNMLYIEKEISSISIAKKYFDEEGEYAYAA